MRYFVFGLLLMISHQSQASNRQLSYKTLGFTINFNDFGLFDTGYYFVERSCTFQNYGYQFSNKQYYSSSTPLWQLKENDSLLNMTFLVKQASDYSNQVNTGLLKPAHEKKTIVLKTTKQYQSTRFRIELDYINGVNYMITYCQSIGNDLNVYNISTYTKYRHVQLSIGLQAIKKSSDSLLPVFLKILNSIIISKI